MAIDRSKASTHKHARRPRVDRNRHLTLLAVDSTAIQAVGYDARTRRLEVLFKSGHTYCYVDVPPEVYERLLTADSKGSYLQGYVIDVYPYRRGGCG